MEAEQVMSGPISEVSIEVPWGHIAGKIWGPPSAPPVLCVHGIQDNANSFDILIPFLPTSFCYVAIDLPGCGRSSHFPEGFIFSLAEYCTSVNRVVNHFGWKHFIYMGHSLGGQIGWLYSACYPEQVLKLVILDAVPPHRGGSLEVAIPNSYKKLYAIEKKMLTKSPPSYSEDEALQRLADGRPFPLTREAAQVLFSRGVIRNGDGFSFSYDQRQKLKIPFHLSKSEVLNMLTKVQCPTFLLRASETDQAIGDYIKDFENVLKSCLGPNFFYKLVEGSHDVHLLNPERFSKELFNFLVYTKSSL